LAQTGEAHKSDPEEDLHGGYVRHWQDESGPEIRVFQVLGEIPLYVGVKIDRKQVEVEWTTVNLLLWDLAGKDEFQDVPASYLRGSGGLFYVVDGTRRETLEQLYALHEMAHETVGDVPTTVALNKKDLTDQWLLRTDDYDTLSDHGLHALGTSAKTGEGVEEAFLWLAAATIKS
jgi:signal recognition particle receptor subunit beta